MTYPVLKFFFGYSINMPNPQQNKIQNETEQTKKEINLLQGRLKKNKKSQNKFQNGLMRIKNTSKKNTKTRFF